MPTHTRKSSASSFIDRPILIVDKEGILGGLFAKRLEKEFITVLVSKTCPQDANQVVYIPFSQNIPVIPDNTYSHIVLFYSGEKEILAALPSFIAKAEKVKAIILFVVPMRYATKEFSEKIAAFSENIRLFVYGEPFGNNIPYQSLLSKLLYQAKNYGSMTLPQVGLATTYPVWQEDIFQGLLKACFSMPERGVVLCYPPHGYTALSLSRIIQKKYPDATINVEQHDEADEKERSPEIEGINILQETSLSESIEAYTHIPIAEKALRKKKRVRIAKLPKLPMLPVGITTVCVLLLLVLPSVLGSIFLFKTVGELEKGSLSTAHIYARLSLPLLRFSEREVASVGFLFPQQLSQSLEKKLKDGEEGASLIVAVSHSLDVLQQSLQGRGDMSLADSQSLSATLKRGILFYETLKAQNEIPDRVAKNKSINDAADLIAGISDSLPSLLGFPAERKYLILFQNNMELRPGGGFIGSYGLLTIAQGKIKSFIIHDVYDADGQLKGHIDPPFALSRYLGSAHWFLRDSNMSPDFGKNAQNALYFLNLETGEQADGVVGIDVSVLQQLLRVTGPLYLSTYNETVTADNFYLLTQKHVENNFFPGSTQKKDFLRSVSTALEDTLLHGHKFSLASLSTVLLQEINEKHMIFADKNEALESIYAVNGIGGTLWDSKDVSGNGVSDMLAVSEANVGQNKVNYYIKRSINEHVEVGEGGGVHDTVTLTYTNSSTATSPFGGTYKNYLRLFVPLHATLTSVHIDGVAAPFQDAITDPAIYSAPGFLAPTNLEVEHIEESDKTGFGFLVPIPPSITKTVTISYTLPTNLDQTGIGIYSLHVIKQPGTDADPFDLSITLPQSAHIESSATQMGIHGNTAQLSMPLRTDLQLAVKIVQ